MFKELRNPYLKDKVTRAMSHYLENSNKRFFNLRTKEKFRAENDN